MLLGASAWKLEGGFDLPLIVTRTDFLFENHELVLHPWVDVALVVLRPEAPERVADYVAEACLPLDPKDITAQLSQNIFPLVELLSLLCASAARGERLTCGRPFDSSSISSLTGPFGPPRFDGGSRDRAYEARPSACLKRVLFSGRSARSTLWASCR
jgi:hypothetical protein